MDTTRFLCRALFLSKNCVWHRIILVAAVVAIALPLVAEESTWSQWRGPGRDGFVAGADWPDGLSQERLQKRWRVDLGQATPGP